MARLLDWYRNTTMRRILLPLLKRFNPGDVHIRHHYTGERLLLHSYRHKGYWFHGRRRERQTMDFFRRVISPGDCVVEVGGHIGYVTLYFAQLVGVHGHVVVFEPGSNNLPYLRANTAGHPWISLVDRAASNTDGLATFMEENLTGQNNSLCTDYRIFRLNRRRSFDNAAFRPRQVETMKLDTYVLQNGITPHLVKIDVEGAELLVLEGCVQTIHDSSPIIMVEVTEQKKATFELLTSAGYRPFSDRGTPLLTADQLDFNVCALHPDYHAAQLRDLGWGLRRAA